MKVNYAIYHEGMKEFWELDDMTHIIDLKHLNSLPEWNEWGTDLRGYSWEQLQPHATHVLSYIPCEIENEPEHVTYIDELLWLLEDYSAENIEQMSDCIPEWLESLKATLNNGWLNGHTTPVI